LKTVRLKIDLARKEERLSKSNPPSDHELSIGEDQPSSDWEVYDDAFKNHLFKAARIGVTS